MEQLTNNLLALHYIQPMSLKQLTPLLKEDPHLNNLNYMNPLKLAKLLKMTIEKTTKLLIDFNHVRHTNWAEYYRQKSIHPVLFFSSNYPLTLLEVYDPPAVLYCKGDITILPKRKKLAIVGSRKSTNYSQKSLEHILPVLISQDIVIVSGLARGADQMAHSTTMKLRGSTIAVLGNGLDFVYPREHHTIQKYMEEHQLVITEYPPYMGPKKWHFPMRNRIISGLSDAILVTEAAIGSGTMSTVDYGLNHGKNIFSIPGNIFSTLSGGPHMLIQLGATPIWSGQQIIEETQNFT